jgi:hypothetical protein
MYLEACDEIAEQLLSRIEDRRALRTRLTGMGHHQFIEWIGEHMDEVTDLISSSDQRYRALPARRRDMLLYSSATACRMAQGLLEQALELGAPVNGPAPAVVADMAQRAWRACHRKMAPWPFDEPHPFAQGSR